MPTPYNYSTQKKLCTTCVYFPLITIFSSSFFLSHWMILSLPQWVELHFQHTPSSKAWGQRSSQRTYCYRTSVKNWSCCEERRTKYPINSPLSGTDWMCQRYSCYMYLWYIQSCTVCATKRVPEPCSWTSFISYNFSIIDPMSKMLWFYESLERDLSNDVFKSKFGWGHNLSFFSLGPWAIIHGIWPKLANSVISQI